MERKAFLKKFALGGSLLLTAPVIFSSCSKDEEDETPGNNNNSNNNTGEIIVDLNKSDYAALKTVGGYAYTGNIIVIRTSDTQYMALSKICTHENCTVNYSGSQIVCPCHQSKFDTSGNVLQGPATKALQKYTVTVDGTSLKIK